MSPLDKDNHEMVFKPSYPTRIRLTVYLYPFGVIFFIYFIYLSLVNGKFFPYGLFALVFGFTISTMPMILFREIRFQETSIRIKRYFLPAHTILYQDIVDLTPRGLVAKRGGVPLVNVLNRKDFEKMIHKLVSRGKITLTK